MVLLGQMLGAPFRAFESIRPAGLIDLDGWNWGVKPGALGTPLRPSLGAWHLEGSLAAWRHLSPWFGPGRRLMIPNCFLRSLRM